jgi:hypothetical protein
LGEHGVAKPGGVEVAACAQQRLDRRVVAPGQHCRLPIGPDHPPGQRPGAGTHVVLGVAVAVPEREQLHELAGQVLIGRLGSVALAVQPPQHRRVGQHRVGQGAEVAEVQCAQLLILRGHVRRDPHLLG